MSRNAILPHLWISDHEGALEYSEHVALLVNVTVQLKFPSTRGKNTKRIRIPVKDDPNEAADLVTFLKKTTVLADIDEALSHDLDVLVHCEFGMQRSPAVVACYLIQYRDFTPDDAIQFIKGQRAVAFPGGSRFLPAIEAIYRSKVDKQVVPPPPPAVTVIEPLASLFVQPLQRLVEIVSDDPSPRTSRGGSASPGGGSVGEDSRTVWRISSETDRSVDSQERSQLSESHSQQQFKMDRSASMLRQTLMTFANSLRAFRAVEEDESKEKDAKEEGEGGGDAQGQGLGLSLSFNAMTTDASAATDAAASKPVFWHGLKMPGPVPVASPVPRRQQRPHSDDADSRAPLLSPGKIVDGASFVRPSTMATHAAAAAAVASAAALANIVDDVDCVEVVHGLFLGNDLAAHDPEVPFHVIVNCTVNLKFPNSLTSGCRRIRIPVDDDASQAVDLYNFIRKTRCLQDMRDAVQAGRRVLVYCDRGMQRAAAVLASYFVVYDHASPADAVAVVRRRCPSAFADDAGQVMVTFQSTLDAVHADQHKVVALPPLFPPIEKLFGFSSKTSESNSSTT